VLSLEFNRLLEYYKDAPVLDIPVAEKKGDKKGNRKDPRELTLDEKDRRTAEKGYERIYINLGKADGFFPPNLIDLINQNTKGSRINLGRIDLLSKYSLFDVNKGDAHRVISALKNSDFFGKRVYAEVAVIDKDYSADSVKAKKRASRSEITDNQRDKNRSRRDADKPRHDADKPRRSSQRTRFEEVEFESQQPRKGKKKRNSDAPKHGNFDIFSKKKKR
jgi:ATP-dependent RNA helicase DeaD